MSEEQLKQFRDLYLRELSIIYQKWWLKPYRKPHHLKRLVADLDERYRLLLKTKALVGFQVEKNREVYTQLLMPVLKGFSHFGRRLDNRINDVLKDSIKKDFTDNQTIKKISEEIKNGKRYGQTWVFTSVGGINKYKRLLELIESGYTTFMLDGPPPQREFCKQHYRKQYSIDEIRALDNGQNLSAEIFCGGYNCRHFWSPVYKTNKEVIDPKLQELKNINSNRELINWCEKNVAIEVENNLQRFNIEDLKQIAETLYKLNKKYGLPPLIVLGRNPNENNAYYAFNMGKNDEPIKFNSLACIDEMKFGISVVKYMKKEEQIRKYKYHYNEEDITLVHSFYLSLNMEDITVHEYGHRFHISNWKELNDLYKENVIFNNNNDWLKYMKGRAADDVKEYMAEMFSRYYHNQPIPLQLKEFFSKRIKDNNEYI